MILFTIACAPSFALARTDSIMRSRPNSSPSVFSASVTPSVEDEAIIALERDGEVNCEPVKHVPAVNSHDHSRRLYWRNSLRFPLVKQRRIVAGARESEAIALVIQNQIGHADEHVFLDIGIKLTVHLSQD